MRAYENSDAASNHQQSKERDLPGCKIVKIKDIKLWQLKLLNYTRNASGKIIVTVSWLTESDQIHPTKREIAVLEIRKLLNIIHNVPKDV